jgi:hypothetical protein
LPAIIHVDRRHPERSGLLHLAQRLDTGCRLLGDTDDVNQHLGILVVHERGQVTTVIEQDVGALAVRELQALVHAPDVLVVGLALPGEDGGSSLSDGCGCSVLR